MCPQTFIWECYFVLRCISVSNKIHFDKRLIKWVFIQQILVWFYKKGGLYSYYFFITRTKYFATKYDKGIPSNIVRLNIK